MLRYPAQFLLFTLWFLSPSFLASREYLYPVAAIEHSDGSAMVYVLHQISPTQTSLLLWNPETQETFRGLSAAFSPAGFTLLPQKNGFSFIDEGRIRIKYFEKRAPRAIDLYEPLSTITLVHWIDNNRMYLSAQKDGRYGIFQVSVCGDVVTLCADQDYDYQYPCKIGDQLFFCRRSCSDQRYTIMSIPYPALEIKNYGFNDIDDVESRMTALISGEHTSTDTRTIVPPVQTELCDLQQSSAIFLNMVSATQGFYIEHSRLLEPGQTIIDFHYHRIYYELGAWKNELIFSFSLPYLLFKEGGEKRCYESILPFIPRHIKNKIYFSDFSECGHIIELKSYDTATHEVTKISNATEEEELFAPLSIGQNLCFGGLLTEKKTAHCKFVVKNGKLAIDLPVVPL